MDEPGAVWLFLEHVAGLGHRRAALIDGPSDVDTVHRREMAARRLCAGRGLQLTVLHADATEEGGWAATQRLLRRAPLPITCAVGSLNQLFGVTPGDQEPAGDVMIRGPMSLVLRQSVTRPGLDRAHEPAPGGGG